MYRAHFGLKKNLFDTGIAQDVAVFRCAKREPITANLAVAFTSPDAIVTLSGTAGVGKTTLISAALRARSTRLALAWLNAMPTNATELLELLLVEFGFNAHRATRIERLQMWRQFVGEMSATESRVFIVVERTEDLPPEVLRALDSLTAADTNGCAGANVVLLGNEGLDEHLKPQLLDSLRQRIRLRQRLVPFTVAELEEYVRHHVACAGGEFERVFAPGAVGALHRYSNGIARIVNNLGETALTLAASERQPRLTAELIETTAIGWFGVAADAPTVPTTLAPPAPRESSAALTPAITPAVAAPAAASPAPTLAPVAAALHAPAPVADSTSVPAPVPAVTHAAVVAAAPVAAAAAVTGAVTSAPPAATAPHHHESASNPDFTETDYDFDGVATDIPEVAMTDFPVLTDAVETLNEPFEMPEQAPIAATPARVTLPAAAAATPTPVSAATPRATPAPAPAAPARPPAAAARAAAPTPATPRVDTAYAPKRAPIAAPTAAAKPAAAAEVARKPLLLPLVDEGDGDELRQTQTMRAISVAKSIDDISNSMAETLFGEADLDMLSAALASAGWSEEETATATPPEKEQPKAAAAPPVDDPFDLFDLGPDAPLELIDDSVTPSDTQRRRMATQR